MKQLNYHVSPKLNSNRYVSFSIKKKSGKDRIIHSPNSGLKMIQSCLALIFQVIYQPPSSVTGFVKRKSIVDNAKIHINRYYVFNIDLKDFFTSIDQARLWGRLKAEPFNLSQQNNKLELSNLIASICCHEIKVERYVSNKWIEIKKNVLPQGAPTSPIMSNIICQRLDYYLTAVSKRFGLKYTRYVDDITFSSDHNVYQVDGEFRKELKRIIDEEGFYFNSDKTRLQKKFYKQEVTGVIVNEKVNANKRFVKRIKKWLYLWENYGYDKASVYFISEYRNDRINLNSTTPLLENVLRGKLNYLRMLKGNNDSLYISLYRRFNNLIIAENDIITYKKIKSKPKQDIQLPIVHYPKDLIFILKKFSQNNTALKYSTHTWDGGKDGEVFYDIDSFLAKAKDEYSKFSGQLIELSYRLNAKIWTFIFSNKVSENGWGMHHVKFGWSSPQLKEYLLKYPDKKPENYILPESYQFNVEINNKNLIVQSFKHVIDIFKNEIEIRDENSALENIIIKLHKKYLNGFKIKDIQNLRNKSFYIDVDYFYKALELVFENIQKRPEYPMVSYIVNNYEDYYSFEILHHESTALGKSIKDEKLSLNKGDFGTIKDYLINLCDWSIESEFLEGNFRINYLVSTSNGETKDYEEIKESNGFKYIFKFYK